MVIAGSWVGEEEEDLYVGYAGSTREAERERLYEAVYQSDTWLNDIGPRVPEYIEREQSVITRLEPTPKSVLR